MSYDGQIIWSKPTYSLTSSIPIGDVNGDFKPEIIIGMSFSCSDPIDPGLIECIDPLNYDPPLWTVTLSNQDCSYGCNGLALGDIHWHGNLELAAVTEGINPGNPAGKLLLLNAADGTSIFGANQGESLSIVV